MDRFGADGEQLELVQRRTVAPGRRHHRPGRHGPLRRRCAGRHQLQHPAQQFIGYWRVGYDNLNGWPWEPSSFAFGGSLDDFTLYQYQMSAAQVAQLYAASGASAARPSRHPGGNRGGGMRDRAIGNDVDPPPALPGWHRAGPGETRRRARRQHPGAPAPDGRSVAAPGSELEPAAPSAFPGRRTVAPARPRAVCPPSGTRTRRSALRIGPTHRRIGGGSRRPSKPRIDSDAGSSYNVLVIHSDL